MNRKFLFSFLLLTFSLVNFLQAQNMWEEFHLIPQLSNLQFVGKYVWLGYSDGAIRIDTINWSCEYFNYNAKPDMILSNGVAGNIAIPEVYKITKHDSEVIFFQSQRALHYDGNNFNEEVYPNQVNSEDFFAIDSSGTIWYDEGYGGALKYLQGGNWNYTGYNLEYLDTMGCLIVDQNNSGLHRICSPASIDTFIFNYPQLNIPGDRVIDSHNWQWGWSGGDMKVYRFDGTSLTTIVIPPFPITDTALKMLPLTDHSQLFYGFNNFSNLHLAYLFNGTNFTMLDTSLFGGSENFVQYFGSPSGRIFALVNSWYYSSVNLNSKLYSSLDGINWQEINLSDINNIYGDYGSSVVGILTDSLENLYFWGNEIKKITANWSEQICPIAPPSSEGYYDISASASGICWIQKFIDSTYTKFYKWNTSTNQVDSFPTIQFPVNYVPVITASNDSYIWLYNYDTLYQYDGNSIIYKYPVNYSSSSGDWWSQFSPREYRKLIGNTLYAPIAFSNSDSAQLYKFENGIMTNLCLGGIPKLNPNNFERDHLNNIWCSSKTALYKFNGSVWDSIPLPFTITTNYGQYDPKICFDDSDRLFILMHDGYYSSHFYEYNSSAWTEFPAPTPTTFGYDLFFKDGFLWTTNGQSLLRFDPNGIPNTLGSTYIVKGKAYHDLNANNIQNTNESGKQNVLIQSSSGDFSFTQYYGNYLLLPDSGQNTITCTPPLYYTVTPATVTVNNTGANPVVDSVDFALQPLPGMNDLSVDVTHYPFITWNTNPGISYWVSVKNPGTTVQSATLTFNVPDTLVIAYVYPTPTSNNGNQLTWSLSNLAIDTSLQFYITATFPLPTPIGSTLVAIAEVQSASTDLTPANNIDTVSYLVTGPYDPNMKLVDPMGEGALGITDTTHHVFTYTIYFQNTGNDTAVNVRVDDFLDADFDWTSFNLISSSAPVDFDLNQNGFLRFHFNNIMLPDSNVNEAMSHGFVKYSLRLKSGPSLGKQLTNAASIYFDYQPPIFTNSTLNTIGMETGIGAVSYNSNSVTLFPNPSNGLVTVLSQGNKMKFIAVYDLSGRLCYTQEANSNQATINIQSLAQGLYLVKIKLQNGSTELKKLVKE